VKVEDSTLDLRLGGEAHTVENTAFFTFLSRNIICGYSITNAFGEEKSMRKLLVTITALLMISSIAVSMMASVKAGSIDSRTNWVGYAFKGTDGFYDKDVVAYKASSLATLAVEVRNTHGVRINVSAVGVSFDWPKPAAGWYNSTEADKTKPIVLEDNEIRYVIVNFTTPDVTTASMVLHDYTVYVEFVEFAGGSLQRWETTRSELFGLDKQYFVVYTADQAQAKQMAESIDGIKKSLGWPTTSITWTSTKAGLLWKRAMNETTVAEYYYNLGGFTDSKSHYSAALSLIIQAFDAEQSRGVRLEDAELKSAEAEAKYFDALANFYNGISNMWTLFGVALVLFAIGYIIRGFAVLRKTAAPT